MTRTAALQSPCDGNNSPTLFHSLCPLLPVFSAASAGLRPGRSPIAYAQPLADARPLADHSRSAAGISTIVSAHESQALLPRETFQVIASRSPRSSIATLYVPLSVQPNRS